MNAGGYDIMTYLSFMGEYMRKFYDLLAFYDFTRFIMLSVIMYIVVCYVLGFVNRGGN